MAVRACGRSNLYRPNPGRRQRARAASAPGQPAGRLALGGFHETLRDYFAPEGCIVDQPFQPRLLDGMIRCYMGADKVVGFGHQFVKALIPPPPDGPDSEAASPARGSCIRHRRRRFRRCRTKMETEWTPQMMQLLEMTPTRCRSSGMPTFFTARAPPGEDTYVLCEINVSSVFSVPEQARRLRLRAS